MKKIATLIALMVYICPLYASQGVVSLIPVKTTTTLKHFRDGSLKQEPVAESKETRETTTDVAPKTKTHSDSFKALVTAAVQHVLADKAKLEAAEKKRKEIASVTKPYTDEENEIIFAAIRHVLEEQAEQEAQEERELKKAEEAFTSVAERYSSKDDEIIFAAINLVLYDNNPLGVSVSHSLKAQQCRYPGCLVKLENRKNLHRHERIHLLAPPFPIEKIKPAIKAEPFSTPRTPKVKTESPKAPVYTDDQLSRRSKSVSPLSRFVDCTADDDEFTPMPDLERA